MTVPSREEVASEVAERLIESQLVDEADAVEERWFSWLLDELARAGHPVLMGYDHGDCETCEGTGIWLNEAEDTMPMVDGVIGVADCPDGDPIYWEAP